MLTEKQHWQTLSTAAQEGGTGSRSCWKWFKAFWRRLRCHKGKKILVWISETQHFQTYDLWHVFPTKLRSSHLLWMDLFILTGVFKHSAVFSIQHLFASDQNIGKVLLPFLETPHSCSNSYCSVFNSLCFCPFLAEFSNFVAFKDEAELIRASFPYAVGKQRFLLSHTAHWTNAELRSQGQTTVDVFSQLFCPNVAKMKPYMRFHLLSRQG